MQKFILNCAVTGAIHTPTMAPHLPIRPEDIAVQAIEAARAWTSTIHVHARDPKTGMPTGNIDIMGEIVSTIHAKCDAVICITTGGGMNMSVDDRIAAVPVFQPELASCNLGSMNFALFPILEKIKNWRHDWELQYLEMSMDFVFRNTFADLERILKVFAGFGTRPDSRATVDIEYQPPVSFAAPAHVGQEPGTVPVENAFKR